MDDRSEVHVLAAGVHGALVVLHLLGLAYNVQRRNRLEATIHGAATGFSLWAVRHHIRESTWSAANPK